MKPTAKSVARSTRKYPAKLVTKTQHLCYIFNHTYCVLACVFYCILEYEVVVVTGGMKGAGTDANIHMTLFGKSGQTPKMHLKTNKKSAFERNSTDVFKLKVSFGLRRLFL